MHVKPAREPLLEVPVGIVLVATGEDSTHVGKVCLVGDRVSVLEDVWLLERSAEIVLSPLLPLSELMSSSKTNNTG